MDINILVGLVHAIVYDTHRSVLTTAINILLHMTTADVDLSVTTDKTRPLHRGVEILGVSCSDGSLVAI